MSSSGHQLYHSLKFLSSSNLTKLNWKEKKNGNNVAFRTPKKEDLFDNHSKLLKDFALREDNITKWGRNPTNGFILNLDVLFVTTYPDNSKQFQELLNVTGFCPHINPWDSIYIYICVVCFNSL